MKIEIFNFLLWLTLDVICTSIATYFELSQFWLVAPFVLWLCCIQIRKKWNKLRQKFIQDIVKELNKLNEKK